MAKKDRKQRRKHLQPEHGSEKQHHQLITELGLVSETENDPEYGKVTPENNSVAKFLADYRAYRKDRDAEDRERTLHRSRLSLLGIFTMLFAVIGVIATLNFVVNTAVSVANQTKLKEELTPAVSAYVVNDVPEFTDPSGLSDTVKQRICAWYLLLDTDLTLYQKDDYDNLFVPFEAMNLCAKKLFGNEVTFTPKSDYTGALSITYDPVSMTYLLPMQPDYATYYPHIASVKKQKDGYRLEVQYLATDLLENLKPSSTPTVIKTMQFDLIETEYGMQVTAVMLLSIEEDNYYQPGNQYDQTPPALPDDPTGEDQDPVA